MWLIIYNNIANFINCVVLKSLSLSQTQQKAGFADLDGSFIEIDYTSQQEKDLDKRRRHLFRLILANKVEYLFQAPSENQMMQWYKTHTHMYTHQGFIYKLLKGANLECN